ncbi:MAG: hypothetical protein ACYC2X_11600 [Coriobacteriia bacterium]
MDLARYVVEAVVPEGHSYREGGARPRGLEDLGKRDGIDRRWLRSQAVRIR